MADAYLNAGATSLAAANWSDATGFAANAELNITTGNQSITAGLAQGGSEINYLRITPGFTGNIGTAATSLAIDAQNAGAGYIQVEGGNRVYMAPADCDILRANFSGSLILTGSGTVTTTEWSSGSLTLGANVTATTFYGMGGSGLLEDGPALTTTYLFGGTFTARRPAGTIYVGEGATLIYDNPDGDAATALYLNGGYVDWRGGNIPTFYGRAGVFDASNANRDVTLGATAGDVLSRCRMLIDRTLVDDSNLTYRGAQNAGSGPIPL